MPRCDVKKEPRNPIASPEADRFTGYNLPMVKLDDGFEYYVVGVHPYFLNQPQAFQKPAFSVGFDTAGGHTSPIFSPNQSAQPRGASPSPKPLGPSDPGFILPI
jgi:hypothetical protein